LAADCHEDHRGAFKHPADQRVQGGQHGGAAFGQVLGNTGTKAEMRAFGT